MNKFKLVIMLWLALAILSCQKPHYAVKETVHSNINVKELQVDNDYTEIIKPYKNELDAQMNVVIGVAQNDITKAEYQSLLGNFIADLVLKKSIEYYEKPIDFSVVTNGGLRINLSAGNITMGHIYELMPFENELVVLTLSGEEMIKLFQYAALKGNVTFSGVQYEIKNAQPKNIIINGHVFDYDKTYTVAISDYLADGGDRMEFLKNAPKREPLGKLFRDAIIEHIKTLQTIDSKLDDRVKILN